MGSLLVSAILAICPAPIDGNTNECMEQMVNCAVKRKVLITKESVDKCVEEYKSK